MLKYLFLLILFISCASDGPEGKTEAEVLYKEALELIDSGRLIMANERLNLLKSQHPYSYYATHAELLQADILFKQENYVEAAAAYLLFRDFHPKHKQSDYVLWRIGESYYYQLPSTFDRDLSSAFEAMKYYKELLKKYPDYKDTNLVHEKINSCEQMLIKKERYIADFYYRTDVYQASRVRYQQILDMAGIDEKLKNEAIWRIVDSSRQTDQFETCLQEYDLYFSSANQETQKKLNKIKNLCQEKDNS